MATTNAGNSQGRERKIYTVDNSAAFAQGEKKIYRSSGNYNPNSSEKKPYNGTRRTDSQPRTDRPERGERTERGDFNKRPQGDRPDRNNRPERSDRPERTPRGDFNKRPQGDKPRNNFSTGKGFDKGYDKGFDFKDKDEDDVKRRPQKAQTSAKPKEVQPDKAQISMRLEKEKKAVKKKQDESRKEQKPRPTSKPKRANNIDWTKAYENDEYDDDDFDMYL